MSAIVAVTTIRQGSLENVVERMRAEVALDTARALQKHCIPLLAIHSDCTRSYLATLRALGVTPISQRGQGSGNARRQGLRKAPRMYPNTPYFLWLEPEKPDLPRFVRPVLAQMEQAQSDFGLFNRLSLDSYPTEQGHYYGFCKAVATTLIGYEVDYGFGPMILSRQGVREVLAYQGEYGDTWNSILIPKLRAIARTGFCTQKLVDFENDHRMTAVESGNRTMILKRLEQLNVVIPALLTEWEILRG